jgi:MFS family permease
MGPVRSTTPPCTRRCALERLAANRVTAAAAAQPSVSIVAFGLPAVGPDLREAYGLSLTMLGAALAATILGSLGQEALIGLLFLSGCGSAVVPIAGTRALFSSYEADRQGWALGVRQMSVPLGGTLAALLLPGLVALGGIRLALVVSAVLIAVAGFVFAGVAEVEGGSDERAPFALSRLWRTAAVLAAAGKPLAAPTLP